MSTLEIDLDPSTGEALSTLANARGTTPAGLAAEIVARYVSIQEHPLPSDRPGAVPPDDEPGSRKPAPPDALDTTSGSIDAAPSDEYRAPPDPLDELVGKYSGDEVNNIDEVVYGR